MPVAFGPRPIGSVYPGELCSLDDVCPRLGPSGQNERLKEMSPAPREPSTIGQLRQLLLIARAHPAVWTATTVAASIILAFLDMLGVAAMIPLTQLLAGGSTDSGALGVIAGIVETSSPATLIPIVAGAIAVLFVLKSALALLFRWWLFGQTTRVGALVSTALMSRYVLAPYAQHRTRRLSEVYRNITAAVSQAVSVLLAVISMLTDVLMLAGIVAVLAITARSSLCLRSHCSPAWCSDSSGRCGTASRTSARK